MLHICYSECRFYLVFSQDQVAYQNEIFYSKIYFGFVKSHYLSIIKSLKCEQKFYQWHIHRMNWFRLKHSTWFPKSILNRNLDQSLSNSLVVIFWLNQNGLWFCLSRFWTAIFDWLIFWLLALFDNVAWFKRVDFPVIKYIHLWCIYEKLRVFTKESNRNSAISQRTSGKRHVISHVHVHVFMLKVNKFVQ